jgi:dipeptidase D
MNPAEMIPELEPRTLWKHFAELNAIPRPSKKEERIVAFMRAFGEDLGLETRVDDIGNVIIRKPATPGMEERVGVVLQGHLDMVHQKNAGTDFDFDSQGIRMRVEGDWVAADGTTLGADNGIGVAAIMAILASDDIPHPAIEALFTVDEETGMTGATGLKKDVLSGSILLNLDTEDDTELTIGCAGAVNVLVNGRYDEERAEPGEAAFVLRVCGLAGGHSGMDIHRGRANANKSLNRLLFLAQENLGLRIAWLDAGGLRNAIPREASACISVNASRAMELKAFIANETATLKTEYAATDPGLEVCLDPCEPPDALLGAQFQRQLLSSIYTCPNGIFRMSPEIEGLVQTSNNLAKVAVADGAYQIHCLVRSALDSEKLDLARAIRCSFEPIGARVEFSGSYPGWTPRPDAPIVKLMSDLYLDMFGEKPSVLACHAGLECGIVGARYPEMQMISFGPTIRGAHSPDERVQISSVQKFWRFLRATLEKIPRKPLE